MKATLTAIVFVLLPGLLFAGLSPLTADEIVKKANHMALYQGQDTKGTVKMEIKDSQGRIRQRALTS